MDGSLVNVEGVRTEKEQGKEVSQGSKHRGDEGGPPCPLNCNGWWSLLFFFFFLIFVYLAALVLVAAFKLLVVTCWI